MATQTPPGPFPPGVHEVTLVVTNDEGAESSCDALVTVVDATAPVIAIHVEPVDGNGHGDDHVHQLIQFNATDACSTAQTDANLFVPLCHRSAWWTAGCVPRANFSRSVRDRGGWWRPDSQGVFVHVEGDGPGCGRERVHRGETHRLDVATPNLSPAPRYQRCSASNGSDEPTRLTGTGYEATLAALSFVGPA